MMKKTLLIAAFVSGGIVSVVKAAGVQGWGAGGGAYPRQAVGGQDLASQIFGGHVPESAQTISAGVSVPRESMPMGMPGVSGPVRADGHPLVQGYGSGQYTGGIAADIFGGGK